MRKLLMLKGLPASGKSTYAHELVRDGWTRVNKDDIRAMLHGGKWSRNNEKEVVSARNVIILSAMAQGKNVVVDDTNYHPSHEEKFREFVSLEQFKDQYQFETRAFDTDVEECIKRDLHRGDKAVGEQVIRKMWRENIAPVRARHEGPKDSPAVIFDIDGTLAKMNGRSPYDYTTVDTDLPVPEVVNLLSMFRTQGYKVLVFSGRQSSCREMTLEWLKKQGVEFDAFEMRNEYDLRKDYVVKQEFYDKYKGSFDIKYAVDDRLQVCRLWHELGLCLLKVGDPDLEF
jgi:predicted kinase